MATVPPAYATARKALLAWYDAHARALPWRVMPAARARGIRPDPYRVWLSEIMLQQTTTAHAAPYFRTFTQRWPTVEALARAEEAEVMSAWAGLGYYARARNLIACARKVAEELGGVFPRDEERLRALPGVGAYTAAAVAAIAFDRPANVMDANVERVMARWFAVETPLPEAKGELKAHAAAFVAADRPGDWAQALMDLGAVVCTPTSPDCSCCPTAAFCKAARSGAPERLPMKAVKAERPRRQGVAYVLTRRDRVALVRRPARGLLGGMLGLPTSEWRARAWSNAEALDAAPAPAPWRPAGEIDHVFTHFALSLRVFRAEGSWDGALWTPRSGLDALPTVFLKAARVGLGV